MTDQPHKTVLPTFAPAYAAMYPALAEIARRHGYALAVHGSMQRDFDLIAIPFTEDAAKPLDVVSDIEDEFACERVGDIGEKAHGRIVYTLSLTFGECFLDLSFMPAIEAAPEHVCEWTEHPKHKDMWKPSCQSAYDYNSILDEFTYCGYCAGRIKEICESND